MDERIELALELKTAIIIVSGDPWRVRVFNQKAIEWFGDVLNHNILLSKIIPTVNEKALKRRLAKGREATFDFEVQLDRPLPVEFSCSHTKQIENGVILEGVDLTRVHSAELMLSSYSRMIEEKTKELESAIQARDQFFATMSHELRTPLNSIIGFTESLIDEVYGEFNEEQLAILNKIFISGQDLMSLLTNLLYLSRIRSGKLDLSLKRVDLIGVCKEAIDRMSDHIQNRSMNVKLISPNHLSCWPEADVQWCQQMIEHLLSNAIKFSDEGSQINLVVSSSVQGVRVTVSDEGIGIPVHLHNEIFQPFMQVENSLSRSYQGSGLGLSVVDEVIRLHGGQVSVESRLGQGSKFHLDFICECD